VKLKRQSVVLLIPMSMAWVLDVALTLRFQPAGYWAGDYSQATEAMAVARLLLGAHPLGFIAGSGAYLVVCSFAVLAVRPRMGRYLTTVLTSGHTWGASSWLWLYVPHAYWSIVCLYVTLGVCLMACLEWSIRWHLHEWPAALRGSPPTIIASGVSEQGGYP
jgi:hypothetical protein